MLDFVRGEVLVQELDDVHSKFPAGNDPPAREVLVDGPTVSERYFTPELDTVNNHVIKNFDHWLIVAHFHFLPNRETNSKRPKSK